MRRRQRQLGGAGGAQRGAAEQPAHAGVDAGARFELGAVDLALAQPGVDRRHPARDQRRRRPGRSRGRAARPRGRARSGLAASASIAGPVLGVDLARGADRGGEGEGDAQPLGRACGGGREGLGGGRHVVAVGRDVAGEDVEQQRRVGDVAGQRAVAAEAVEGLGVGPGGDPAALGLEPDQVGPGGGDADRAGAVGADRAGDEPGRDRRGGAAAGAARRVLEAARGCGWRRRRGSR